MTSSFELGGARTRPSHSLQMRVGCDHAEIWAVDQHVAKIHAPGTDPELLARRLAVASDPQLAEILVAPLAPHPHVAPNGRLVTLWPRVEVVEPQDVAGYPWAPLGDLLAGLHDVPIPPGLPRVDPGVRARRVLARLPDSAPTALLTAVLATTAATDHDLDAPATLVHGDVHLGQLGRRGTTWLLLDLDDLAVGDPVGDLARLGAFWAAGLLPTTAWQSLLTAYHWRRPGGIPADDTELWRRLDRPARIALVTAAARAVISGQDPEATDLLLGACARIVREDAPR